MNTNTDRLTGLADECAPGIDEQIAMHKELGWNSIELRNVGGINICEMDDDRFEEVYRTMQDAHMRAACFASAIANWARSINTPFEKDEKDLLRSIPRMRKLGTNFIRIMSYQNDGASESEWKKEAIARLTRLTRIAEDNDVVLVLETVTDGRAPHPNILLKRCKPSIPRPFGSCLIQAIRLLILEPPRRPGIGIEPHCRISCISTSRIAN